MSLVFAGFKTWGPFAIPHFVNVIKGNKRKATPEVEIIGLKDPDLFHKTASGTALTETTFDTVSRPDEARILFTNASGTSQILTACWIRGKLVKKVGGESGYTHDTHIDYEAIARDGEKKFELGNDYIVTLTQVNKLADYHWKYNRTKKHIYTVSLAGVQSWFEPGEWYQLTVGAAGTAEYIDSIVECYSVRTSYNATGSMGTQVSFREVEENWKFDSNALARYVAAGGHSRSPQGTVVTVGAATYPGYADYYCDGTADESEINAAIALATSFGSGTVRLMGGTFVTAAAIELLDNVTLAIDSSATIEKNCDDYAIKCTGDAVTYRQNVAITGDGRITQNAADTNTKALVWIRFTNGFSMDSVNIEDAYRIHLYLVYCSNFRVTGCHFRRLGSAAGVSHITAYECSGMIIGNFVDDESNNSYQAYGISVENSPGKVSVQNNTIVNMGSTEQTLSAGIYCAISNTEISGNYIDNIISATTTYGVGGVYVVGSNNVIHNNMITNLNNTANSTQVHAIWITTGSAENKVSDNYCLNNGSDTGLANTNSCHLYDLGTNTQIG